MKSSTETLIKALEILAKDIVSDVVANAVIAEAAEHLQAKQDRVKLLCEEVAEIERDREAQASRINQFIESISQLSNQVVDLQNTRDDLERQNAELVAMTEALSGALEPAVRLMRATGKCSGWHEKADEAELLINQKLTPAQHLRQIQADAVMAATDHCEEYETIISDMQRDRYETIKVCTVDELKKYAERVKAGE